MIISTIKKDNIHLLQSFIKCKIPSSFRYFKNRSIEVIKNHKLTIIGYEFLNNNKIPIGYSHIDNEDNINWIGICVLKNYQGKGFGKQLFLYILDYIKNNNIQNVKLTVDIDNYIALNMYLKNNFSIEKIHKNYYTLQLLESPLLEVSLGEAIDKLTILDIKKQKIKDHRIKFVEKEYNILYSALKKYIVEHKYYYNILLDINKNIWEMQDEFRYSTNSEQKQTLCLKIIDENDRRFRVKKKINNLCKSKLKEQKGYKPKKAFVLTHLGMGDCITSIGAVRYLSTTHDEVYVVCKDKNKHNLIDLYKDDIDIKIYPVHEDKDISPRLGCNYEKFKKITKNFDLFMCGSHLFTKKPEPFSNIPFNFYTDLNIDVKYFWKYFHIHISDKSKMLYNSIKEPYIFVHNSCSNGEVFTINSISKILNINENDFLVINPCKNLYNDSDKYFNIAQSFVNKPMSYYIETIINSNIIVLTDSSFFCLSINLPIKTNKCYYVSRDNRNYDYLYDEKYFSKNKNKKKFQCLTI